jgi:hypothetical protein
MEATCSFETPVDFQQIAQRYIPEDKNHYNHRCENLRSYNCNVHSVSVRHSVVLVRKRTIPTERPQPASEVSANFSW